MRVLSGIQPTGRPHWGNYFGAIAQYIELQNQQHAYYFIANLHALTSIRDKDLLAQLTYDAALDLLALGLDPEQAVLFVQSDVPEVSELCWLLMSDAPMGLLERCVSYKDKVARGLTANVGLFAYPVLQAADILAYDADIVPVGEDQVQHIEVCRDLGRSFNHVFGDVFVLPKPQVLQATAKVPGTDGEKMSKSYNNDIEIFEPSKSLKKKVMRIATDSRPMEDPKDPQTDHLYQLYSLFVDDQQRESMASMYRAGGFGYGEVKKALAEVADEFFAPARQRRMELQSHPQQVKQILGDGAQMARKHAAAVLRTRPKRLRFEIEIMELAPMNVVGIGTDIVEVLRIAQMIEKHEDLFLTRVYTSDEISYCSSRKACNQHYAGRWAAKEAALKALGTGWARGIHWTDIEVTNQAGGAPLLLLHNAAEQIAHEQGIIEMKISISHCRNFAIAFVTALAIPI